jgi:hypothetical protein
MGKNIIDLGNIETNDLIGELRSRGVNVNLLWSVDDVDLNLETLNSDRDDDDQVVLDDYEKQQIIDNLDFSYYTSQINNEIYDTIWELVKDR